MRATGTGVAAGVGVLALLAGCKADYSLDEKGASAGDYDSSASASDDTGSGGEEEEDDFLRMDPAATDAYVFVANATRDSVTRISVPSLETLTADVGAIPTAVLTTADYLRAVTLNEGSDTMSVIDAETLAVREVAIRENFNRISLAPSGKWAMAWYDPDRESQGSSGGVQSFNEVSFVDLESAVHWPMVVGFNPENVRWAEDGLQALVVSDASLALVDLSGAPAMRLVELAEDPLDAPDAEEVEISPDGRWAFVRQADAADLVVVSLAEGTVDRIPLAATLTDLDLSPDGSRIAAVAKDAHQILSFDPTNPYGAPSVVELPLDGYYGSVLFAGDSGKAVLYTNSQLYARYAVWDVATGALEERPLVKPVRTIGVSPTGGSLIVFHTLADDPDASPNNPFLGEYALTMLSLSDGRENPLLLPAEPTAYSVSDDGRYGFFIMEGYGLLEVLPFDSLLPLTADLPSLPVWLGVLPGTDTAYVSQEHDLGRISFYDAAADAGAGSIDTITGFELNSGIEH